jgi:hypothetical protein
MNFWIGVIIALVAGVNIGIFVTALLTISKRSDYEERLLWGQYPMDEAVMDDPVPSITPQPSWIFQHLTASEPHALVSPALNFEDSKLAVRPE